jgi:cbb3-type cytochrome oxidase subunit 3
MWREGDIVFNLLLYSMTVYAFRMTNKHQEAQLAKDDSSSAYH